MYFCVGFHKTGTTSLTEAFNLLGIKAAHHPYKMFAEYMAGKRIYDAFEDNKFISDGIVYLIYKELYQHYPNAKFILTLRSPDTWIRSVREHFEKGHQARPELGNVSLWDYSHKDRYTHDIHEMAYGQRYFDEEIFRRRYEQHNEDVLVYFKARAKDLLVMNLEDESFNWQALCDFLQVEIPDMPFPHLRKTERSENYFIAKDLSLAV